MTFIQIRGYKLTICIKLLYLAHTKNYCEILARSSIHHP